MYVCASTPHSGGDTSIHIPRRTLVTGLTWTAPAAAIALAVPAYAASQQCTSDGVTDIDTYPDALTLSITAGDNTHLALDTIPDGYSGVSFQSVRAGSDSGASITFVAEYAGAQPDPAGVRQPFDLVITAGGSNLQSLSVDEVGTGSRYGAEVTQLSDSSYRVSGAFTAPAGAMENFRLGMTVEGACGTADSYWLVIEIAMESPPQAS